MPGIVEDQYSENYRVGSKLMQIKTILIFKNVTMILTTPNKAIFYNCAEKINPFFQFIYLFVYSRHKVHSMNTHTLQKAG